MCIQLKNKNKTFLIYKTFLLPFGKRKLCFHALYITVTFREFYMFATFISKKIFSFKFCLYAACKNFILQLS